MLHWVPAGVWWCLWTAGWLWRSKYGHMVTTIYVTTRPYDAYGPPEQSKGSQTSLNARTYVMQHSIIRALQCIWMLRVEYVDLQVTKSAPKTAVKRPCSTLHHVLPGNFLFFIQNEKGPRIWTRLDESCSNQTSFSLWTTIDWATDPVPSYAHF